jgi:hypothetical protein
MRVTVRNGLAFNASERGLGASVLRRYRTRRFFLHRLICARQTKDRCGATDGFGRENRFLALPARSSGRSSRAATGRMQPSPAAGARTPKVGFLNHRSFGFGADVALPGTLTALASCDRRADFSRLCGARFYGSVRLGVSIQMANRRRLRGRRHRKRSFAPLARSRARRPPFGRLRRLRQSFPPWRSGEAPHAVRGASQRSGPS